MGVSPPDWPKRANSWQSQAIKKSVATTSRKAKPRGALTDTTAKQAKATEKAYKLTDGNGLYLMVNPNGSKLWRWKYRSGGKEKLMALGMLLDVSLTEARDARDAARKKLVKNSRAQNHQAGATGGRWQFI